MIFNGIINFSVGKVWIKLSERDYQIEISSSKLGDTIINNKTGRVRPVLIVLWDSINNKRSVYSEIPESEIPLTAEEFKENLFKLDLHLGIWVDINAGHFLLVRDIFGITPIFYHYQLSELTFSSNVNGILEILNGEKVFNNTAIVNYLKSITLPTGYDQTYFENINRLSPGCYLSLSANDLKVTSYLAYNSRKYSINNGTLDDYGEILNEKLIYSLKRNVGENTQIGLFLSGGLDSSSISVLTRSVYQNKDFYTYFYDSGELDNSDRPYVNDVISSIKSVHRIVKPQFNNLHYLEEQIIANAGPSVSISGGLPNRFVREIAADDQVSVLLSGHCGDNIVDHGYIYLNEIFDNRQWEELNEIQLNILTHIESSYDLKAFQHLSKSSAFFNNVIYNRIRERKSIYSLFNTLRSIGRVDTGLFVLRRLIQDIAHKMERIYFRDNILVRQDWINDEYNNRKTEIANINIKNTALSTKEYLVTEELETLNSFHSTKVRFPFLDRELYELSLAVPNKLKYNNGLTRGTLRAAMADLLPNSVSNRVTKHVFGENMNNFSQAYYKYYADYLTENAQVWDYVDKKAFSHALSQVNKDSKSKNAGGGIFSVNVFKTISLAIWLNHYSKRPYEKSINKY